MESVWNGGEDNLLPPDWWSETGYKKVKISNVSEFLLRMEEPAANLEIFRQRNRGYPWRISRHKKIGLAAETSGYIDFSTEELQAAFGLTHDCPVPLPLQGVAAAMLRRLDATIVVPGKFVRAGRYLSLPDIPSLSGVPNHNVVIYLEDQIVSAINNLVMHHERPAFY